MDSGLFYCLDGEGGLIDSDGDALFLSELPDYITAEAEDSFAGEGLGGDVSEDAYYGSDPGDGGYDPYSDPGDYGINNDYGYLSMDDYVGTWERYDSGVWYTIHGDGTYKKTYLDGDFVHGNCWMNGYQLVMDGGNTLDFYQGNVVDENGDPYYSSVEPSF